METNKDLLDQVIQESLYEVQDKDVCSEPHIKAFKESMEALDRRIEIEKLNDKKRELAFKEKELEFKEKELALKEKSEKTGKVLKCIEVVAVPLVIVVAENIFKYHFMKSVCNFEKDYTFTTTPGRSISGLFKWKK